ncbi:hypothetical protein KUG47_01215 [Falsochrobactrum sp. TDYN1]|uniref:Uncharacterized protein n=1 Tax=Falsochrobactrum tianjinense TaxID=2706015 RepID=A0A949PKU5_9HYPH|nr:hypothetical protein [Falsochrobactrum sp. TDYN1]MBV2142114.1 hypothetical protein [Falsochrobactrum sp. TDYN1]
MRNRAFDAALDFPDLIVRHGFQSVVMARAAKPIRLIKFTNLTNAIDAEVLFKDTMYLDLQADTRSVASLSVTSRA